MRRVHFSLLNCTRRLFLGRFQTFPNFYDFKNDTRQILDKQKMLLEKTVTGQNMGCAGQPRVTPSLAWHVTKDGRPALSACSHAGRTPVLDAKVQSQHGTPPILDFKVYSCDCSRKVFNLSFF